MTVIGKDARSGVTFPVQVATNTPYLVVSSVVLASRRDGPGTDIVLAIDYVLPVENPPAGIALLAVFGADIIDPISGTLLHPRVYDEWGPTEWADRPTTLRIAAPLSASYWVAPLTARVDLLATEMHVSL